MKIKNLLPILIVTLLVNACSPSKKIQVVISQKINDKIRSNNNDRNKVLAVFGSGKPLSVEVQHWEEEY